MSSLLVDHHKIEYLSTVFFLGQENLFFKNRSASINYVSILNFDI